MKVHLLRKVGKNLTGLSCSSVFTKGLSVSLQIFVETKPEERCKKCQKIASKLTSYA
jgi:hypothetical protein